MPETVLLPCPNSPPTSICLCRELDITRAIFVGVSIGGYALFEFWRRYRERVAALVLANTRAGAETPEGRAARLQIAEKVEREGTATFIDDLLQKLFSKTTLTNRPDIVDAARAMAKQMSPADIAQVQRGMADRADSVATLAAINVPTLVIAGEDDSVPLERTRTDAPAHRRQPVPSHRQSGPLRRHGAARRVRPLAADVL